METQVCSTEEMEAGAKEALESSKKLDRRIRKEKDRQNMAAFGLISFEQYIEEIDPPPSSTLRLEAFKI